MSSTGEDTIFLIFFPRLAGDKEDVSEESRFASLTGIRFFGLFSTFSSGTSSNNLKCF